MATLGKFATITAEDRLYDTEDDLYDDEYYAGFGYGNTARELWRQEWELEDHYRDLEEEHNAQPQAQR